MWEGGAFLGALTPKFYVALTGTSSLISGLILIFEWWYFRKYGTSFIEQVSLAHLAPWLAGPDPDHPPGADPGPGPGSPHSPHSPHPPGAECKVWRNPMALLRGAEYSRLWAAARRPPLTYYDMNLSAQDHQAWFGCGDAPADASGAEAAMCRAWREREPAARVAAARRALALCGDCAPALLLLAEEDAPTVLEASGLLRRAWRAADRAARAAAAAHDAAAERRAAAVRAHVRRRAAVCARRLGRLRDAARLFRDLAREAPAPGPDADAAPHENLLEVLLEQRLFADAAAVLARCEDAASPPSAALLYTAALLRARAASAAPAPARPAADLAAVEAMRRAVEFNPYVPAYLLEQRALRLPPEHVVRRGDSEALAYAFWHLRHWRAHEPALRLLAAAPPRRPPAPPCADRDLLPPPCPSPAPSPSPGAPSRRALPAAALLAALLGALALLAHRWPLCEPRAVLRLLALL